MWNALTNNEFAVLTTLDGCGVGDEEWSTPNHWWPIRFFVFFCVCFSCEKSRVLQHQTLTDLYWTTRSRRVGSVFATSGVRCKLYVSCRAPRTTWEECFSVEWHMTDVIWVFSKWPVGEHYYSVTEMTFWLAIVLFWTFCTMMWWIVVFVIIFFRYTVTLALPCIETVYQTHTALSCGTSVRGIC